MREESYFRRLLKRVLIKLGILQTTKINKKIMCEKAILSNVCPKECDICAWNEN